MSVINQMLKDLESRKDSGSNLPQPDFNPQSGGLGHWLIRLVVIALLMGAGYWLWLDGRQEYPPASPLPEAPATLALVEQDASASLAMSQPALEIEQSAEALTSEPVKTVEQVVPQPEVKAIAKNVAIKESQLSQVIAQAKPAIPVQPEGMPAPEAITQIQANEPPPQVTEPAAIPTPAVVATPARQAKIQLHRMSPAQVALSELKQAREAQDAGNLQQTEASYQTSLRMNPSQWDARVELAQLYLQQQRLQDAWQQAEQGIKFHPRSPELYRIQAEVRHQQGQLEEAWNILSQIDESKFLNDDFLMLKAGLANKLARHELAYILYVRLTERTPNIGRWWFGRALSAELLTRAGEARYCYQRALNSGDLSSASHNYATSRMKQLRAL